MPPLPRRPAALEGRVFDLLVVGGGINGTGVARDAARRGLSVALVEKEDFGYGTTGRSTRLIHGGLRYLAMYDFGLVRESLHERELLFRNAPHLVHPLTFLIPFYRGQRTPPWMLKVGLHLYDALAGKSIIPSHQVFGKEELLALEPGLSPEGLRGGASYGDGQVELVERLCVENVLDAAAHGAVCLNHATLEGLERGVGSAFVARVRDALDGSVRSLRARHVVNATGPWLDRAPGLPPVRSRMTKGTHIVTPRATRHAILLFSPDDDRVFFSIPWLGHQLVGTTDRDFDDDPDAVAADADDVTYLQRGIRQALPHAPVEDVLGSYAGVRNLVFEEGKTESEVSRRHQILQHEPGLLSLVGGKITPYRRVCEEVVDRVAPGTRSDTARAPLPGAPRSLPALVRELEVRAGDLHLPPGVARTLATTYGALSHDIMDRVQREPAKGRLLCPHAPTIEAEVDHAVEGEMARSAGDVLLRRTRCGWEACQGLDALPVVLDRLDAMLGRSAKEREEDEGRYRAALAQRHAWRQG